MQKGLGRPPKKEYDPEALMQELIDTVAGIYQEKQEIKATALELSLPPNKVKKLLITGKVLTYPETKQIQELLKLGKTITEIQETMGLSYSALHTYLPYTKVVYKMSEISQNAERVRNYKLRKSAVEILTAVPTEEHLWDCIVVFPTLSLPYRYRPAIFLHTEDREKWRIHQRTFHRPPGEQQIPGVEFRADGI